MKKKESFVLILFIIVVLLVIAGGAYQYLSKKVAPQGAGSSATEKIPAPDFSAVDMDGNLVSLSELQGKPVVINFWASWCGYCVQEMPYFEEAYQQYGDDVHFMMIDMVDGRQETVDSGKEFLEGYGYTFPVYFDTAMEAAYQYQVTSLPTTLFIDENGNLADMIKGAISQERLTEGVDALLTSGK